MLLTLRISRKRWSLWIPAFAGIQYKGVQADFFNNLLKGSGCSGGNARPRGHRQCRGCQHAEQPGGQKRPRIASRFGAD